STRALYRGVEGRQAARIRRARVDRGQDHDHPELSSAIKLSITDIIPCGHDA
ncbi:unnamed protein product, partial [Ascophyllum nodosum]